VHISKNRMYLIEVTQCRSDETGSYRWVSAETPVVPEQGRMRLNGFINECKG